MTKEPICENARELTFPKPCEHLSANGTLLCLLCRSCYISANHITKWEMIVDPSSSGKVYKLEMFNQCFHFTSSNLVFITNFPFSHNILIELTAMTTENCLNTSPYLNISELENCICTRMAYQWTWSTDHQIWSSWIVSESLCLDILNWKGSTSIQNISVQYESSKKILCRSQ